MEVRARGEVGSPSQRGRERAISTSSKGWHRVMIAAIPTNCTPEPYCGDGNVDAGEECDDGNNVDGDGCDANCSYEVTNPGTGTPGYWKNDPEAWPVEAIVIGGVSYTVADGIAAMSTPPRGDNTYLVFRALVSAILNVQIGNDSSCVADLIDAGNAWAHRESPWQQGQGEQRRVGKTATVALPPHGMRTTTVCCARRTATNHVVSSGPLAWWGIGETSCVFGRSDKYPFRQLLTE